MQKMKNSKSLYLVMGAALCLVALLIFAISRPLDSDAEADQRSRTKSVLSICGSALDSWSKEHHRLPSVEEGLSVLEMKVRIPLDGWGRPIIFKRNDSSASSRFQLYSRGKNGIDENGAGDDMSYRSGD
jgi:hypothetical protein